MSVGHALAAIESSLRWVLVPVLLLSLTVCCLIIVSGWQRRQGLVARRQLAGRVARFELAQTPFVSGMIEVPAEMYAVLRQFEGRAAKQLTALEIAVQPGLTVRLDAGAFRAVLSDMVALAIAQAPCGRVLVSAARVGNRVQVCVSDDGAQADGPKRQASLRDAERLAALHGALMRVDARPPEGTTVRYMLPVPDGARSAPSASDPVDPANVWAGARRDRDTHRAVH